jgi:hypothetical protein
MSAKANIQKRKHKISMDEIRGKIAYHDKLEGKGSIANTAIKTGVETALSVLGGGALGSVIGRPAFFVGLGLTAIAHYTGHSWASPIGIGMMSSGAFTSSQKTVGALDVKGQIENAKERLIGFKDSLLHRTYTDKLLSKGGAAKEETTNGIGQLSEGEETLRQIEKQLTESANEFSKRNSGTTSGLQGEAVGYNETDFSRM